MPSQLKRTAFMSHLLDEEAPVIMTIYEVKVMLVTSFSTVGMVWSTAEQGVSVLL